MAKSIVRNRFIVICLSFLFLVLLEKPVQAEAIQLQSGDDLQEAVNKADEGEIIHLSKGFYQGPIIISKPLTLMGEEGAIIDGGKNGSVIIVKANHVTISGLTIRNSGREQEDSGVYLQKTESNKIQRNQFVDIHYGIYIKNGKDNQILENSISGYDGHFSKKGNGIHIFKGEGNLIKGNNIDDVQDGVYFDFAKKVTVLENVVRHSRYALHYMFSEDIYTEGNIVEENVTGFMIMDSKNLEYYRNRAYNQFHFRGYGILIYDTKDVILRENEIVQNSVGLSLEKAENTEISRNIVAANQVGLEFRRDNLNNFFSENNFMANIVSSTIGKEELRLDNGERGNYWDDYKSYDITGDGVGEIPYKAGSLYDNLLKRQSLWQFYFESPAIILWSKAESMFPSLGTVEVYDNKPLIEPVNFSFEKKEPVEQRNPMLILLAVAFLGVPLMIILKGRKYR